MEKFRSTNFNLVLYEEDKTHMNALEKIKASYDYAFIVHDLDVDDSTGELKKAHYHVVIRFKNAKWNTALAEELGITENYLQDCRSLKRSLLYLIHYYEPDKHQYDIELVQGPLKKRLKEFITNEGKSESEKVLEIFQEIDKCDYFIDYKIFVKHIAKIGYWDVLRRSSSIILRYLDLHNQEYRV